MKEINIKQERKACSFSAQTSVVMEERHSDLADFMKGTISGNELVKHVCDRLDEKYGKSRLCGL
jgi:hypothetical protein